MKATSVFGTIGFEITEMKPGMSVITDVRIPEELTLEAEREIISKLLEHYGDKKCEKVLKLLELYEDLMEMFLRVIWFVQIESCHECTKWFITELEEEKRRCGRSCVMDAEGC